MREIKFRGKRKDNGEWVYGYYIVREGIHFIVSNEDVRFEGHTINDDVWHEVLPETAGQWTGSKDMNKKEIYEGDTIESSLREKADIRYSNFHGKFYGHRHGKAEHLSMDWISHYCVVIGDIHFNPELLDKKE